MKFFALAALAVLTAASSPNEPPLVPKPPGTIVQNAVVYLTGEAMNSKWHVVASRMGLQWYLSIYAPPSEDQRAHLAFRSPGKSPLLSTVARAPGTTMAFPFQALKIVGGAELEQSGVQDAVVMLHESGADCGMAKVIVLGANPGGTVRVRKSVSNYCELNASIVRNGDVQAVRLQGPKYGARSSVCCPVAAKAAAILSGRNGRWRITPPIFPPPESRLP